MIIARCASTLHKEPEDREEIGRKLAMVAGVTGLSEGFIVRKAAIDSITRIKAHVAHVIRSNNEDDRAEMGRKLAMVAGIL